MSDLERRSDAELVPEEQRAEYLAFLLAGDAYAIAIASVVEILRPLPVTEVPRAPTEVLGVMNARGRIVTVLDLRERFALPTTGRLDRRARVLLVDVGSEIVGLLVEEVLQVVRLAPSEIEPPDRLGPEAPSHVVGIARPRGRGAALVTRPGGVVVLVDLGPLFVGGRREA